MHNKTSRKAQKLFKNPSTNYQLNKIVKNYLPHGLHGNWLKDVLSTTDTYTKSTISSAKVK